MGLIKSSLVKTGAVIASIMIMFSSVSFATSLNELDMNGSNVQSTQSVQSNQSTQSVQENSASADNSSANSGNSSGKSNSSTKAKEYASTYSSIAESTRLDLNDAEAANKASVVTDIGSKAITFVSRVILVAIVVFTIFSILFMVLPPLQEIVLGDVSGGNGIQNGNNGGMNSWGNSDNSWGNSGNSWGNSGSSFGGNRSMASQQAGGSNGGISKFVRMCVMSQAITACSLEKQGQIKNRFSYFFKNIIVVYVMVVVLLVISSNGVLINVGFNLGGLISKITDAIANMIGDI